MTTRIITPTAQDDPMRHANMGWQCPECFGVQVSARQSRFDPSPTGWLCEECGCQWSRKIEARQ